MLDEVLDAQRIHNPWRMGLHAHLEHRADERDIDLCDLRPERARDGVAPKDVDRRPARRSSFEAPPGHESRCLGIEGEAEDRHQRANGIDLVREHDVVVPRAPSTSYRPDVEHVPIVPAAVCAQQVVEDVGARVRDQRDRVREREQRLVLPCRERVASRGGGAIEERPENERRPVARDESVVRIEQRGGESARVVRDLRDDEPARGRREHDRREARVVRR